MSIETKILKKTKINVMNYQKKLITKILGTHIDRTTTKNVCKMPCRYFVPESHNIHSVRLITTEFVILHDENNVELTWKNTDDLTE